ncbi:hypothetical protein L9F63_006679 [Diploptera punctata]|uniref:Uncharacterized protein n=1 Tax=Diploptera punctata TaxID=6984 RepID=A0AAD7Z9X9_DIPPU|nr:hypothetical protein L9F63_006679 [Diploptera punctata]
MSKIKFTPTPVKDLRDLRERIIEAIENIPEDILQRTWQEMFIALISSQCSNKNDTKLPTSVEEKVEIIKDVVEEEDNENPMKKIKLDSGISPEKDDRSKNVLTENIAENEKRIQLCLDLEKEAAPPFYFNLHRHSPKGPKLLRVDTVIQFLHKAGYRASRTHFDREAVRTNASLTDLVKVLTEAANVKTMCN